MSYKFETTLPKLNMFLKLQIRLSQETKYTSLSRTLSWENELEFERAYIEIICFQVYLLWNGHPIIAPHNGGDARWTTPKMTHIFLFQLLLATTLKSIGFDGSRSRLLTRLTPTSDSISSKKKSLLRLKERETKKWKTSAISSTSVRRGSYRCVSIAVVN